MFTSFNRRTVALTLLRSPNISQQKCDMVAISTALSAFLCSCTQDPKQLVNPTICGVIQNCTSSHCELILILSFDPFRKMEAPVQLLYDLIGMTKWGFFLVRHGVNVGGWFDRLLLTEKTFSLQRYEAVNCCVLLHCAAPSECRSQTVICSSITVKPRHNPVPALRVNRGVHIPWLDKQRPEKKKRRRKQERGRTVSMPIMHEPAWARPRHWDSLEIVFNHLMWPINVLCW